MNSIVRTRFAPSPTGLLHVGGVRTALFSWLIAKQANGKFVLRIEDTDQKREVSGAADHIIECLNWLGLDFDGGPIYQSQRVSDGVYKKWAEKLIEAGRAYSDPYTKQEVQAFREEAAKNKQPFLYRNHRPENITNWDGSQPLRFKSDPKSYKTTDAVMGEITTGPEVIDDFILIKSDGYPTYNFAHIVDDIEMRITHVIRGQEFLPSTPNYRNLYEALAKEPPIYATVPHIMNEHGNKKLSKRDGAKDLLDYRAQGFLPEAMINFLATLGWNDGTEQEVFSRSELIEKFSLDRIQKSGAHFDERRLLWLSGAMIRELPLDDLMNRTHDFWPKSASNSSDEYKKQVLAITQERLKYFSELPSLTKFFFEDLTVNPQFINDHKQLKKLDDSELIKLLEEAISSLTASNFSKEDLTERLNNLLDSTEQKPVVLFSLIRIAITQAPASPGLSDTLNILGRETSLRRIANQLEALKK